MIGKLLVDKCDLYYRASAHSSNIQVAFALAAETGALPLTYKVTGSWKGEPLTAEGRAGGVLQLSKDTQEAFPFEVSAVAGKTRLKSKGTVTNLTELSEVDATFDLQGQNLESLYRLAGVVLPSTPLYKLRGTLTRRGQVWAAENIRGVLGSSDLSGALSFDTAKKTPLLTGKVRSKVLYFADLAPVIGLASPTTQSAKTSASSTPKGKLAAAAARLSGNAGKKVLPTASLDLDKLNAMNADVE